MCCSGKLSVRGGAGSAPSKAKPASCLLSLGSYTSYSPRVGLLRELVGLEAALLGLQRTQHLRNHHSRRLLLQVTTQDELPSYFFGRYLCEARILEDGRSSRGDSFAPQDAPHVFLGPFKDGPDLLQGRFQVYADKRLVVFLQVLDVGFRALGDDVEGL